MNELSTAVRFLNLTAMVVLAGGFGFALFIARPAYRGAKAAFLSYLQPQLRIARWCLLPMFALAFAGLWLQALYVGEPGGPDATGFGTAFPLLLETRFGRVWLLRIALLAMLSGLFAWATRAELENNGGGG